jgi:hypothetical protein
MEKLSKFKSLECSINNIYGGQQENNTKTVTDFHTDPNSGCPCGDFFQEIKYDGSWAKENFDYCTIPVCKDCPTAIRSTFIISPTPNYQSITVKPISAFLSIF